MSKPYKPVLRHWLTESLTQIINESIDEAIDEIEAEAKAKAKRKEKKEHQNRLAIVDDNPRASWDDLEKQIEAWCQKVSGKPENRLVDMLRDVDVQADSHSYVKLDDEAVLAIIQIVDRLCPDCWDADAPCDCERGK